MLTGKWCFSSDLHWDLGMRYSRPDPTYNTTRLADMMKCWRWVVDASVKAGCDRMAVLGDVYNNRVSVELAVLDASAEAFAYAAGKFQYVVVIPGNHDSYLRNARVNAVRPLQGMVRIVTEPRVIDGVAFVPWTDSEDQLIEWIGWAATNALVLASHFTAQGAVPGKAGVPIDRINPSRFHHVFLGDVHDPVTVGDNVRYVGSPMQFDFRDAGKVRGFTVYDAGKDVVEFVENDGVTPQFVVCSDDEGPAPAASPEDFVNVTMSDPDAAQAAVAWYRSVGVQWVQSKVVKVEAVAPRLRLPGDRDQAAILESYVRHSRPDADSATVARLVAIGLEAMAEARL